MSNEIVKAEPIALAAITPYQVKQQVQAIQKLMAEVMLDNTHYGKIPGCGDKPTLLQPGAQKLCFMFGLADDYQIEQTDMPNGHREYRVKCTLTHKGSGIVQGNGYGICSTMESKYRYRNAADYEILDEPIPDDAKARKDEYRKQGLGMKKVNGAWCWVRFKDSAKQENPDIADTYNTVLKMACKRALVHATLNTTAASDIFAQDLEDLPNAQVRDDQPAPQDSFNAYKAALTAAKKERGISIQDAMARVDSVLNKPREEYTQADIDLACEVVKRMTAEDQRVEEPTVEPALEPEDIGF
ncbi:MAG: hypothetical protein IJW29_06300 [Clostridia bacterium]|nr:hypothetical protein [Clostridia bacterium]